MKSKTDKESSPVFFKTLRYTFKTPSSLTLSSATRLITAASKSAKSGPHPN